LCACVLVCLCACVHVFDGCNGVGDITRTYVVVTRIGKEGGQGQQSTDDHES